MWQWTTPRDGYDRCRLCDGTFIAEERVLRELVMGLSLHAMCAQRVAAGVGSPPPPPAQPS